MFVVSSVFSYAGYMNICLIHKGKNNTSGIEVYLQDSKHVVQEVCLQDNLDLKNIRKPDVVIFDIISTKGEDNDYLLLKKIQLITESTPVLLATNSNESSKYREFMLDAGVDGCIQTPFLQEELFLRLEKLMKKKNTRFFSGTKIEANNVEIDIKSHRVELEGEKVSLTKTEYSILLHLFLHKDILVTSKELSSCLVEETGQGSSAINIHIFNLRKKIKNIGFIRTVPSYGFMVTNTLALH